MIAKRIAISSILAALAMAFIAVLLIGIVREVAGTNSYALLADGWLHGRLDTDRCFDTDCAQFKGRTFVMFPPMPAVIILPFVAVFGPDFHWFMPLAAIAFAISGWLWWRIANHETAARDVAMLLVLLVMFATPLFFVTLRGDRIWFFAQSWGFLFSTAAVYFALVRRNALIAGLFIGMAFLSRQMTILYLPFLYVLLLDSDTRLFKIDGAAIRRALALAALPAAALAIYFIYNYARFGSPLETGYSYMSPPELERSAFMQYRIREIGIFSRQYLLPNVIYMFIAGPHLNFAGRYMTELSGFDVNGASLFLVTPALLLAFLARWDRAFWFGVVTVAVILGVTLFYHSNGYSQFSAQRYALDWLPILLVFVARGTKPDYAPPLSIFVGYSMLVTLSMIAVGAIVAR